MIAVGIDPGTDHSGVVCLDTYVGRVVFSREISNRELLFWLRRGSVEIGFCVEDVEEFFIENIEAMGLAVGKSTFQTCIWIGRFIEACSNAMGRKMHLVSRGDEKIIICGMKTYINPATGKRKGIGDVEIRRGLIERFPATGGGSIPQVGTKSQPGPLYGVSGHCWQALSVVVTGLEGMK